MNEWRMILKNGGMVLDRNIDDVISTITTVKEKIEQNREEIAEAKEDIKSIQSEIKDVWTKLYNIEKERNKEYNKINLSLAEIKGELKTFNATCDIQSRLDTEKDNIIKTYQEKLDKSEKSRLDAEKKNIKTWTWILGLIISSSIAIIALIINFYD